MMHSPHVRETLFTQEAEACLLSRVDGAKIVDIAPNLGAFMHATDVWKKHEPAVVRCDPNIEAGDSCYSH